ncbi:MAG TPA: 3-phosphoglycerate dehydrogenase [Candidatus Coprovicinus avistercoris]|uniref:D-3-phosphoglycerate dehydrogenase n=1 Tax=Candidatus Coprovicinus avistercoris TaxID=2840754 RepID=A0A9D1L4V3_9ACTN|nr:3-phosphoglycerate dehydrogenase [Candidatus Coprovicinus avistercoris]
MFKVHCMNNISKVGTNRLGDRYEFTSELADANAILVRSARLHDIELPKELLAIARAGAGVNNIPLDRCAESGIVVFNTPGANANAVKELVLCGMLLACRDIIGGIDWVRANSDDPEVGKKAEKAKKQFAGCELAGKTLGVIGLGAIGAAVANAALSLGMRVLGYDPYLSINAAWSLDRNIKHVTDVNELYSNADFITIHVPATADTKGMIGADEIALMKRGAVVLNLARDVLVDEQAMAEALDDGHIARYVTDFANPASTNMRNAIVTPHLGASTGEAEDNCAIMAVNELKDYLENGNIVHSVNFGAVDLGPIAADGRIAVFHHNAQGMLGKITQCVADSDLNIENMSNKSRGAYAYTLIEVSGTPEAADTVVEKVAQLPDVMRVRTIARA